MKLSRNLLFLSVVFGSFLLSGCNVSPKAVTQNPVAQTQEGIQVGLSIYDANHPTEQASGQKNMKVTVMSPDLSKPLQSPLTIHGQVSGLFFSEGTFPVVLQDQQGREIVSTVANADGDWMTENPVAFTVELRFKAPEKPIPATLIFRKDNPSGLPANDLSQSFAVTLQ